ncbi:MAG TPA: hypothetical protein EYF98_11830 [Planctomycetes bacterium]|nr:hypothetical protein [Planctomycetota bacterium]
MCPAFTGEEYWRRLFAPIVMVCTLLLAGCFFEEPAGLRAQGSAVATLNEMAQKAHVQTGTIPAADLDRMSSTGVAFYEGRILYARMNNHLAHPLGKVTLRLVVTKGKKVRGDDFFDRNLIAAPHSEFQITVQLKRQPRTDETWAWALVDGNETENPR